MAPHATANSESPPYAVNGNKRTRTQYEDLQTESTHSVYPTLEPQCPSAGEHRADDLLHYEDECHPDYEFIRIPKNRNYDIYRVPRGGPEEREIKNAEVALTAIRHDSVNAILWAKMDTGSEVNLINLSTVKALRGENLELRPMTIAEQRRFNMINDTFFEAKHQIYLNFIAGASQKRFDRVRFIVIPDNPENANCDGIPNVLLGQPFLREHAMLMIDVDYCHEPDATLPVLCERASKEQPGSNVHGILPVAIKYPQAIGLSRPAPQIRPR